MRPVSQHIQLEQLQKRSVKCSGHQFAHVMSHPWIVLCQRQRHSDRRWDLFYACLVNKFERQTSRSRPVSRPLVEKSDLLEAASHKLKFRNVQVQVQVICLGSPYRAICNRGQNGWHLRTIRSANGTPLFVTLSLCTMFPVPLWTRSKQRSQLLLFPSQQTAGNVSQLLDS